MNLLEAGRASGVVLDGQSSCVYVAFLCIQGMGESNVRISSNRHRNVNLNKFFFTGSRKI